MTYRQWDIILVPFPFTDLTTNKKRPALIISPDEYNRGLDVIIAFITSNIKSPNKMGDYQIQDWKISNFPKPSMLRMKFATIDTSIVKKKLGVLSDTDKEEFRKLLMSFFS
ncbi:MAG: type II toxin-antitoxin system PemK/MazF family toxin [Spirochaetes bacterium]|nr:MAG: type II toxin-antitoxin system PemK/MazF family toxin [Spirochaetota bacterium]